MVKLFKALYTYCYNIQLSTFYSTSFNETDSKTEFNSSTLQPFKQSILYFGWVDWKFVCEKRVKLNWMVLEDEFEFQTDWEKERERERQKRVLFWHLTFSNSFTFFTSWQTKYICRSWMRLHQLFRNLRNGTVDFDYIGIQVPFM